MVEIFYFYILNYMKRLLYFHPIYLLILLKANSCNFFKKATHICLIFYSYKLCSIM